MDYHPHFTDEETEAQTGKYFVQGLGTESSRARVIKLVLPPLPRPTYRQRQQELSPSHSFFPLHSGVADGRSEQREERQGEPGFTRSRTAEWETVSQAGL